MNPEISLEISESNRNLIAQNSYSVDSFLRPSNETSSTSSSLLLPQTIINVNQLQTNTSDRTMDENVDASFRRFSSKNVQTSNQSLRNGRLNTLVIQARGNEPTRPGPSIVTDPSQRLDIQIYEDAKPVWRSLRSLQQRKIQMELRIAHNRRLLENDHFPDWSVNFNPPLSLLNTGRAVESTVGFRYEQAKVNIRMLIDLLQEESEHLSTQIAATMASLECLYSQPNAQGFNISDATDALKILRIRDTEQEEADLERRYAAIHNAPIASLWKNLPPGTVLPPGALRQQQNTMMTRPNSIPTPSTSQQPQQQNFQNPGRGAPRRPAWRGRGRGCGGRGYMRGVQPQRRNPTSNRRTVQAMMTLLTDFLQ